MLMNLILLKIRSFFHSLWLVTFVVVMLVACNLQSGKEPEKGNSLTFQLAWSILQKRIGKRVDSSVKIPNEVQYIRILVKDSIGNVLTDLDGNLLKARVSRHDGYIWVRRIPEYSDVTLEIQGLDEAKMMIYRTIRSKIKITSSQTTNLGILEMAFIDQIPPFSTSVKINQGAETTNSRQISLHLSAQDNWGVSKYYIDESNTTPNANWDNWTAIVATKNYQDNVSYQLSPSSNTDNTSREEKTVYVWFSDTQGQISLPATDSIFLTD